MSFKKINKFEKRLEESTTIKKKYPDRIPIICEKKENDKSLPVIEKRKYLVPDTLTVGQFIYVIRNRIKLTAQKAIFMFVNNTIPSTSILISNLYNEYKDKDGFLYITITGENTFG